MYYLIDDNLLERLQAATAADPALRDALASVESDPLISSMIWTEWDILSAARRLIQGNNPKNAGLSSFDCDVPFSDSAREKLAHEIAGDPDALYLGTRQEVDREIELKVISNVRDAIEAAIQKSGAGVDAYDMLPEDSEIENLMARLSPEVVAGGLKACAREMAERAVRGYMP